MEQGSRLDSTPVPAKQDTTGNGNTDTGRDAAITKMLTSRVARDAAGRFTKGSSPVPAAPKAFAATSSQADAPGGTIPAPADAPDGSYGLVVKDHSLGLHAAPGASLLVAPLMPTDAGLAAFYMKGKTGPVIYDLTHAFRPEYAKPSAPGSEVVPMIEVVAPGTGLVGCIRADRVEKIHSVIGVWTPVEIAKKHRPTPKALPVMTECPEGMGEQDVDNAVAYPLVRKGETVVYDPTQRDPVHGALCVRQLNNGNRTVMLINQRTVGGIEGAWWVDPVNRPTNREAGPIYTSDGPYEEDHLREKIVGTVVGILVPRRQQAELAWPSPIEPEVARVGDIIAAAGRERDAALIAALDDAEFIAPVSPAVRMAIEGHRDCMVATASPSENDEAFDRDARMQIDAEHAVAHASVLSLADVRAKLTYLLPIIAPDMLDQTHIEHLTKILGDVDGLCRRPLAISPDSELDTEQHDYAFHAAATELRLAARDHERLVNPSDGVWVQQNGGDPSVDAMAPAVAARDAAAARQDQAWRDLFKIRPRTWHQLWLMLRDVAKHFHNHQGIEDEPDVFGTLIGAVDGLRLASKELMAPYDLSSLNFNQLEELANICLQQSLILMTFQSRCSDESPLEHILELESNRLDLLGIMASDEIERRVPTNVYDRNLRLKALIEAELSGNGYIEPKLLDEVVQAWGRK